MIYLCSVCGGDPCADTFSRVRALCRKHHLEMEYCNPGGRELFFRDKGRVQLSDACTVCDEKALRAFLVEPPV